MIRRELFVMSTAVSLWLMAVALANGGMPALLPSTWTKESSAASGGDDYSGTAPYLQAISFFVVVLLVSAWTVKVLWQYLRKGFLSLPSLTYGRALSLVVLWGLLFVVVLTMISGARELMTPGALHKLYTSFLVLLAAATDREMARMLQYLKEENKTLRAKLPRRIELAPRERQRLVKLGKPLRGKLKDVMSIVSPRTFARWVSGETKSVGTKAKTGRRRTEEQLRELIVTIARDLGAGYTEPHPYYAPLQLALQLRGVTPEWSVPWDMVHQTSRGVFGAAA